MHIMLFCYKICSFCDLRCFVAKSVLSQFTRFCMEKNWAKNCACGEKRTYMRYGYPRLPWTDRFCDWGFWSLLYLQWYNYNWLELWCHTCCTCKHLLYINNINNSGLVKQYCDEIAQHVHCSSLLHLWIKLSISFATVLEKQQVPEFSETLITRNFLY